MEEAIDAVARWIRGADRVLFVTGAGISADSGVPTYRGIGGLYEDAVTDEGIPIEEALSGPMFRARPALTWKYLAQIEQASRGAHHNAAHEAIAQLQARGREVWVLTQNVDGFHTSAGSDNVIAIHGDLHQLRCLDCGHHWRVVNYAGLEVPPACERCGVRSVRPEVVLFGESLPAGAVETLERQLQLGFDVVVVVGTTAVFPYIAAPVHYARQVGAHTVEINPGRSEVSDAVNLRLKSRAIEVLPEIARRVRARRLGWF